MTNIIIPLAAAAIVALIWKMRDEDDGPELPPALPPVPVLPGDPPAAPFPVSPLAPIAPLSPIPGVSVLPGLIQGSVYQKPAWHAWGYTGIPNLTDDPLGYNSELYPNSKTVRQAFAFLGYPVSTNSAMTLAGDASVEQFQKDWNEAAETGFQNAIGEFLPDTMPGPGTLRALEIAATGTDGAGLDDLTRGWKWSERFN